MNCIVAMSGLHMMERRMQGLPLPVPLKRLLLVPIRCVEIVVGLFAVAKAKCVPRKRAENQNCKLAIVAIAKNEREYLREWVAFHKVVGVGKIFLYDNDSTDGMGETISDFIREEFVQLIPIHGKRQQFPAYNDAIRRYGPQCRYMAFIDCDEYLLPIRKGLDIVDFLDSFFENHPMAGGVAVNWRMYGSSGHQKRPEGLCIENFVWRAETVHGRGNQCIKTIARPECIRKYGHAHFPVFKFGWCNMNLRGVPVIGWSTPPSDADPLRINHYFTKSKEQWIARRALGKPDCRGFRTLDEFYAHDNNDVEDHSAADYAPVIRELMSRPWEPSVSGRKE